MILIIRYLGIVGLAVVGLLGCESAFEADDYEAERAEYCGGDAEKCEDLRGSSLGGGSSDEVLSSSSVVGVSSNVEISSSIGISLSSKHNSSFYELSSSEEIVLPYGDLTDSRDGKIYKTVVIGSQIWMKENLNFGKYIEESGSDSMLQTGEEKFCYSNVEVNCELYGGLYQWHTVMGFDVECGDGSQVCSEKVNPEGHKGICPEGWIVPNESDWEELVMFLGHEEIAGKSMKFDSTGKAGWDSLTYNDGNKSEFSAMPAGQRLSTGGFAYMGSWTSFWEASETHSNSGYYRQLHFSESNLRRYTFTKRFGFSVRCLKD